MSKIIVLIALVSSHLSVFCANFYVSNAGNDNNNGMTTGTSWATIDKVNGYAFSPGDSILFKRSDTWNAQLLIPGSGAEAGGYITFGAYGTGDLPVFDGTGVILPINEGLIRGNTKNFIIVQDIRVQNVGIGDAAANSGIGFFGGTDIVIQRCETSHTESSGIILHTSSNVQVLYNDVTITNCGHTSEQISLSDVNGFEVAYNKSYNSCAAISGAGIDSKQGSKNGTIHHNEVWGIRGANGIYVDAWNVDTYNIQIYNNYVHDIGAVGIMIGSERGGTLHDVTVHHNIVQRAARGGIGFHNEGTTGNPVSDIYIYNNTLFHNGTNGIDQFGGVRIFDQLLTEVVFKNNIFTSAYNFQIGYDAAKVDPMCITVDNNLIYGVNVNSGQFTAISGANTITENPLFIDVANNDFRLIGTSPAIAAGDNSVWQGIPNIKDYDGVPITDAGGNIVTPGGKVSCGAFEIVVKNVIDY